jgi:hypothetical protein
MDLLPRNFNTDSTDRLTRVTLNAGSQKSIDAADQELINEFLRTKSVTVCPPSAVSGAPLSHKSRKHIAAERRAFRKKQKETSTHV